MHHNFIHHNQYAGLGYGVCLNRAFALIEQNLFNRNRHSIAGSGRPGSGYEARDNVEIRYAAAHCFDMHGGRDRRDGTDIAGDWIRIHHNTFRSTQEAIRFRGVPVEGAEIHHNWFFHAEAEKAVYSEGNTGIYSNVYGLARPAFSE